MLLRILAGMCLLACSASVRADLVNTNFTTNLNGWTTGSNPIGLGDWQHSAGGGGGLLTSPTDTPDTWSAGSQQFRVLLTDQSATTLVAFTTTAASPQQIGTVGPGTTASANQAALIAFLSQLAGGEQITLAFEAFTTGTMLAAVDNIQFSFTLSAMPEPGSFAVTGLAIGGLVIARRRRDK